MKFLSVLILLISVFALVKSQSYDLFEVSFLNGQCLSKADLNECVRECKVGGGSYIISKSSSNYTISEYDSYDCSQNSAFSTTFNCLPDGEPVNFVPAGILTIVCDTSASSQLTSAILFVVGLAFTMALLF
ncbi:hypothetical protein ACTA71_008888 [Dictyostelium dimigraforme]